MPIRDDLSMFGKKLRIAGRTEPLHVLSVDACYNDSQMKLIVSKNGTKGRTWLQAPATYSTVYESYSLVW